MKIAHVTATFPPYRGGTGSVCYNNARELARRGHDVHVWTARVDGAPAREQRSGITIHRLRPWTRVGNAPLLPQLIHALRGFDLLHLHYPFFGGESVAIAARTTNTPLVITYHQDVLLGGWMKLVERGLRWTISRATLQTADRVLFTSRDYADASYARRLLRGRDDRIGVLPNGVDVHSFMPGSPSPLLRPWLHLAADDQVVLLVAGLDRAHAFKGVEVLLQSLTQLPPSVKAVIVGDGDLRSRYAQQADDLGVRARVVFAGRVSDAELPDLYRLADVAVLPSVTMGEAFGLVLVEALASSTPVIASNLPGVRTVVSHGVDGLLVPPRDPRALADALRRVLHDDHARYMMGMRGRAKVEAHYDWRQIALQLETIYGDVLRERAQQQALAESGS